MHRRGFLGLFGLGAAAAAVPGLGIAKGLLGDAEAIPLVVTPAMVEGYLVPADYVCELMASGLWTVNRARAELGLPSLDDDLMMAS